MKTQKQFVHIRSFAALNAAVHKSRAGEKLQRPAPTVPWVKPLEENVAGPGSQPFSDFSGPLGDYSGPLGDCNGPIGSCLGVKRVALGYHPDLPDYRDCRPQSLSEFLALADETKHPAFESRPLGKFAASGGDSGHQMPIAGTGTSAPVTGPLGATVSLPPRVHLEDDCSDCLVEDQGQIGSCTANAVIGVVEYLLRKYTTRHLNMSRMFLYKNTRRLLGWTGDTGAYVRTTIKAMRLFGVPPEMEWPYDPNLLDTEPDGYNFAYAQNFKSLKYARIDPYGQRGPDTLKVIKKTIANGFPLAFGFPVYRSIENLEDFVIPLPTQNVPIVGGHAVMAVGYDDSVPCAGQKTSGALIIRNSWSVAWGDHGYGFLPYDYVNSELATDFWALYDRKWLSTDPFDEG